MRRPTTTAVCYITVLLAMVACGAEAAPGSPAVNLNDSAVAIDVRVQHAKALATDKAPTAVDELLTGLDSRSEPLRDAIVASLRAQKGDIVLLQRAADKKRPSPDRVAALAGVRVLKPKDAGPKLAALLDDTDESIREAVAHTLCLVGTGAAEPKLINALRNEGSAKVRYFLVVALGELKSASAKTAVVNRMKIETDFAVKDALDQAQVKQAQP
jgi:HEAT repeat protein